MYCNYKIFVIVTFLIPYTIALIFLGIPVVFIEISLGQFTSAGLLNCWEFATFFKGKNVHTKDRRNYTCSGLKFR